MNTERFASAALVVAHPDDEILWFSSIFQQVQKIFISFLEAPGQPLWSEGRRLASAQFPMTNVEFIGLKESMTFKCADWSNPVLSPSGLKLNGHQTAERLPGCDTDRYETNFQELRTYLKTALSGYATVVTHNPWGEYGHEDHVQVYRAVTSLRAELGFEVWFDNYASDRSGTLMAQVLAKTQFHYETLPTQPSATREIESLYRKHQCWTWPYDDYRWPAYESFMLDVEVSEDASHAGATLPINYINVDLAAMQSRRPGRMETLARRLSDWSAGR